MSRHWPKFTEQWLIEMSINTVYSVSSTANTYEQR